MIGHGKRNMVTQNRNWFSRPLGNSPSRIETEDHLTRSRIPELLADDLLDKNRIGAQALQDPLLFLQARLRGCQFRRAGGLVLLQLVVLRPRFQQECARTNPESSQEDDVEQDNEAARGQISW